MALPDWSRVLVVVAHPDDESFALGGVVDGLTRAGAHVHVLCLTQGEASTLGGDVVDLAAVRAAELDAASAALGVGGITLLAYPDGRLAEVPDHLLAAEVRAVVTELSPDGVVVFDPRAGVTGHPDHRAASLAALAVAEERGLTVLGWALRDDVATALNAEYGAAFVGYPPEELHVTAAVDRDRQHVAIRAHASQAVPGSVLWRRIELTGDVEHLRRLT